MFCAVIQAAENLSSGMFSHFCFRMKYLFVNNTSFWISDCRFALIIRILKSKRKQIFFVHQLLEIPFECSGDRCQVEVNELVAHVRYVAHERFSCAIFHQIQLQNANIKFKQSEEENIKS